MGRQKRVEADSPSRSKQKAREEEQRLAKTSEQRKQLEGTFLSIRGDISILKEARKRLQTNNTSLEKEEKARTAKIHELGEEIIDLVNNRDNLVREYKEKRLKQEAGMRKDGERVLAQVQKGTAKLDNLNNKIASKKELVKKAISRLSSLRIEALSVNKQIADYNAIIVLREQEAREVTRLIERKGLIVKEIKSKLTRSKELDDVLARKQRILKKVDKEISIKKGEKKNLISELTGLNNDIEASRATKSAFANKESSMGAALADLELKAKTLQKHFDKQEIPITVYPLDELLKNGKNK